MSSGEEGTATTATPPRHRPTVTLAALYGAGGSVIGRRVAERLGVPLLDREIPAAVAERTGVPEDAVEEADEAPRSLSDRLIGRLAHAGTVSGGEGSARDVGLQERRLRGYVEEFMARACQDGGVVIGRGGMVVLRSIPWALHVYLKGSPEARIEQAVRLEGIDRQTAEQRRRAEDRARIGYVSRAYGVDGEDPRLYHLSLDSTALDLETCVELIVAASRARIQRPRSSEPI